MSGMQISCTQKMSQVDQNPVWTADSKSPQFTSLIPY